MLTEYWNSKSAENYKQFGALTLRRYLRFVKPSYDNFVNPSSRFADIVCESRTIAARVNILVDCTRTRELSRDRAHNHTCSSETGGTILAVPREDGER